MTVARVSTITASSSNSFEAAIREGLKRANKTIRGITGLRVVEQKAKVNNGDIEEFRVTLELIFVLED